MSAIRSAISKASVVVFIEDGTITSQREVNWWPIRDDSSNDEYMNGLTIFIPHRNNPSCGISISLPKEAIKEAYKFHYGRKKNG